MFRMPLLFFIGVLVVYYGLCGIFKSNKPILES